MSDLKNILSQSACPSPEHFDAYVKGELSREETHAFESHLNECSFCEEALEGFAAHPEVSAVEANRKIHEKIERKTKLNKPFRYMAMVASVLIALLFGMLFILNDAANESAKTISLNQESTAEEVVPGETEQQELPVPQVAEERTHDEAAPTEEKEEAPLAKTNEKARPTPPVPSEEIVVVEEDNEVAEEILMEDAEAEDEMIAMYDMSTDSIDGDSYSMTGSGEAGASAEPSPKVASNSRSSVTATDVLVVKDTEQTSTTTANYADVSSVHDMNEMLSYASAQINASFVEKEERSYKKKTETSSSYDQHGQDELRKQLTLLQEGKYQEALNQINFLMMKDVWDHNEMSTLQWFKAIALLELGQSAKEELKILKQTKNPYQDEAKKLYDQLY